MENLLTLDDLNRLERGIFATGNGEIPSAAATHIVGQADVLRSVSWVAARGKINDWAIYYLNGIRDDWEEIYQNGFKLADEDYIRKLVPCTDEVFKRYRF